MTPSCCDSRERLHRLEADYERLRLDFQRFREIRETEQFIDSYFQNTVNELHGEKEDAARVISTAIHAASTATGGPHRGSWIRRSPPPPLRSFDSSPSTGKASLSSPITPLRHHPPPSPILNTADFPPLPPNNINQIQSTEAPHKGNNAPKKKGKAKCKTKNVITQFGLCNPNTKITNYNKEKSSPPPEETARQETFDTLLIGDGAIRGICLPNTKTRYYCGGTISTIAHALSELLPQYPRCHSVIVHIGANDVLRGHSLAKIERDFGDLIELVRRHNKILFISGPFPRPSGPSPLDFEITGRLLNLSRFLDWKANMRPNSIGGFTSHYNTHWKMFWLFKENGLLNKQGKLSLQKNLHNLLISGKQD